MRTGIVYNTNDNRLSTDDQGVAAEPDLSDDWLLTVLFFGAREIAEIAVNVNREIIP
jgi:hypothetical protein